MGDHVSAARIQFREAPGGAQQPALVGSEASARSRLEVRIEQHGRQQRNRSSIALEMEREWKLPDRGTVGIIFLIITETALFTMFVAAYLIYIGKSLTGPYPKDVLEIPILATICLLSSSLTIVFAEHALEDRMQLGRFKLWWTVTILLGS